MSTPDVPATDVAAGQDGLDVEAAAEAERTPLTTDEPAQRDDLLVSPEES